MLNPVPEVTPGQKAARTRKLRAVAKKAGGHFVCQHLEDIAREALEEYQTVIRAYVRRRHGVYALYRRGKLQYVGLASNLRTRLEAHLKDRHALSWDRFSVYLTIGDSHLRELEALALRIAKPKGNVQTGKLPSSEDLRGRLKRDIKEHNAGKLQAVMSGIPFKPKPPRSDHNAILAGYIRGPLKLRARLKGKTFTATVRTDGRIRLSGSFYNSPSTAASVCTGRPMNGWTFWEYERARGDWVRLDELRR